MSKTVGALSGKLEGLVEHADQTISAIDADKVRSTLDSAQSFMKRIDDASAEIGPIVADVRKVASDFSGFSTSLNTTLADLQGVIGAFDRQKIETSLDGISSFAGKLGNASNDFDEIIADAKEAADNVNKFTSNVQSHTADVDTIIAQAKQLTTRVNAASARLDGLLGKADQFLGTEGGENFFTEAASAARAIREAAEAVSRQTNAVGGGLAKFSGPGLDNMQALINELRGSVARIDRAVSAISRDPSSVVFGSGGNSGVREYNRR
jgi:phospholipid/cholesterol/gamma-HCH transport system substrate-binding protein